MFYIVFFAVLLFSLSVHEAAHAWMAEKFGDSTGRDQGRISLNPIVHIDLMGTIIFPLIMYWVGGLIFGWAKPVPVNPYNLRNPRKAHMWIAAAGPLSNLVLAAAGIVLFLAVKGSGSDFLLNFLFQMVMLNVLLAVFNLMPIPPLDGSWILEGMLKGDALYQYQKIKPYGMVIFIVVLYTGIFNKIAAPIFSFVRGILI